MDAKRSVQQPPHPRASANFLSCLTFSWLIPIFYRGFKKEMESNDLFEPLDSHNSKKLGDRFEKEWEREVRGAILNGTTPRLLNVIFRVFWFYNFLYSVTLAILELVVRLIQPFLIGLLVRYFTLLGSTLPEPGPDDPTYLYRLPEIFEPPRTKLLFNEGIFFAAAVALDSLVAVFFVHPYMMGVMHQGMQCRVGACSLIYRKALRLSSTALRETTAGQMVNLLSNDVNRFDIAVIFLHYLWMAPVEALIVCYFLYLVVGWYTLFGFGFMLIQIPMQVVMGKKSSQYRLRTAIRTDERIRLMNEVVGGIQVIKMYGWEEPFTNLVADARKKEIKELTGSASIKAFLLSFYTFSARFAIYLTVIGYSLSGHSVTADILFLVTAFYQALKNAMTIFFPAAITQLAEALISVDRLQKFMLYEENITAPPDLSLQLSVNGLQKDGKDAKPALREVRFEDASFKWLAEHAEPDLGHVTLTVPTGSLLAVIGPVGAGKSTLIQGILREVSLVSGSMTYGGDVSYASQEPWLFAGSVRQNILFGLPYERPRYKRVISVCALERDFELFPSGDKTIVGERGTSLSGGQRARINLARAVYKRADIYLLDDPLSAVDTHVGKHLFEDCISGFLKEKTVVLVTHQLQYLTHCDHIVILNNGKVEAEGDYSHLQRSGINFARMLHGSGEEKPPEEASPMEETPQLSAHSRKDSVSSATSWMTDDATQQPVGAEETRNVGGLGWAIYWHYLKSANSWFIVSMFIFLLFAAQIIASVNDYWASKWADQEQRYLDKPSDVQYEALMINVYVFSALNIGTLVTAIARTVVFFFMCLYISRNLHNAMFRRVTCAPMKFFHDNPSGRILNRFSKDMGSIDELLPQSMIDCIQIFLALFSIVILCATVSPILIIPTFFIAIVFYLLRIVYVKTSRNIKRLEGTTRSPVFSHLNASLQGLTTIRAFGAQSILRDEFDRHQDLHSTAWYLFIGSSRAFGFWLDSICVLYIAIVCFVVLYLETTGAEAGLAITQSIGLTGMFQWGMRQSAEMENQMTSVERVLEYTSTEQEPALESTPDKKPPPNWPTSGAITFEEVDLRYDPEAEPVLHRVSFAIEPKEKIGIVGRTGAGKSTLIAAMFRLAYIDGKITVDSVDTSSVGLHDLRSKISIIPQEPVLFSGTLRRNLDPFDEYPDWALWSALEEVELKEAVNELPDGLHGRMAEGGINFSVGQRQLICLARAIVRNNRMLIMDEATANVDPQTDLLIQRTIRRKFTDCTVLTIAHRLNTVMDSDRILVMDAGNVVEMDHPYVLLKDAASNLSDLVLQTGPGTAKKLKSIAKRNFKLRIRREEAMRMLREAQEDADADQDSDSSRSSSPALSEFKNL